MSCNGQSNNPWKIQEKSYPRSGSMRDQLAFFVNYAVLAPSIHNTQPWLFQPFDNSIELFADRSRQLPATDPDGRELMISCGAALTNLLVAMCHFGHEGWVQYAPEPGNPDLLARVRLGRSCTPDHQDESMFRSIRRRRTARRPFHPRPLPGDLQRRLIWLATEHTCWLHFAESEVDRAAIAHLVKEAHIRQRFDERYQVERAAWCSTRNRSETNGTTPEAEFELDISKLNEINGMSDAGASGIGYQQCDRELVASSSGLFVLGTISDTPLDWVRAGEATQKILLRADAENISGSFLNPPCQVPDLREQLRAMSGRSGPPQLVMRMGYCSRNEPTWRRPVSDVIVSEIA